MQAPRFPDCPNAVCDCAIEAMTLSRLYARGSVTIIGPGVVAISFLEAQELASTEGAAPEASRVAELAAFANETPRIPAEPGRKPRFQLGKRIARLFGRNREAAFA